MTKKIIIIAGPNGAGKTTFARSFLPQEAQCQRFINADLIAAGLSPFAPEQAAIKAGRLMLLEMEECARKGESFALETTLAGLAYAVAETLFLVVLPAVAQASDLYQPLHLGMTALLFLVYPVFGALLSVCLIGILAAIGKIV